MSVAIREFKVDLLLVEILILKIGEELLLCELICRSLLWLPRAVLTERGAYRELISGEGLFIITDG